MCVHLVAFLICTFSFWGQQQVTFTTLQVPLTHVYRCKYWEHWKVKWVYVSVIILFIVVIESVVFLIEPAWLTVFVSVSLQQSGRRLQGARKCVLQPESLLWGIQLLHQGHRWAKLRPMMTSWGCQRSSQKCWSKLWKKWKSLFPK